MRKKGIFKAWAAALLACIMMLCAPAAVVEAAYPNVNMFASPTDIKGKQGANDPDEYGGLSHTLINVFLDEIVIGYEHEQAHLGTIYEFEGDTFYFYLPEMRFSAIENANRNNMSVSVIFLLKYNEDKMNTYLIDEAAREPGHDYYAPATTGIGQKTLRAFWNYYMEYLTEHNLHVDNIILGNEVNMPNAGNGWHYSGSTAPETVAAKYADAYYDMWSEVRKFSSITRCSVSLDHSWNNSDSNGFGGKTFLGIFDRRLRERNSGNEVDWCLSFHLYPARLYDTRIWQDPYGLTPNSADARIIDGSNLSAMTNYIRDTYGEEHRIMLTEQGFTQEWGEAVQAASLAYSYYAAMYDPMVDSFLLSTENAGPVSTEEGTFSLNFQLLPTATEVYTRIGNGNAADAQWIADVCLPVIGVGSWEEIIPYYGQIPSTSELREAEDGNWYYYVDGNIDTSFNGLFNDRTMGWWLVRNGKVDFDYTGLYDDVNYGWRYVVNGAVQDNYTGLVPNEYGWWYVENGTINFGYTGLIPNEFGWWRVENGAINFGYTGLAYDPYVGWWYVENGAINFNRTGLVCDPYVGWWYVENGAINFGVTGFVENEYGQWYVENGAINFGYTGLKPIEADWWYVENGALNYNYTGLAYDPYVGWWYVENGAINFGCTGLVCDPYVGWWYVENGAINFGMTGLVENEYGWWLVYEGSIAFGYTGLWDDPVYGEWFVQNGAVVF